jgi:thiamine transport system substrate-binding protein
MISRPLAVTLALGVGVTLTAGCNDDSSTNGSAGSSLSATDPVTVRLLVHGSWQVSDGIFDPLLDEGIEVDVLTGGDAGELANRVVLDAADPQADVVYGIDNTFVGRPLAADAFEVNEYDVTALHDEVVARVDTERIVPIDYGDVCVNYDREWFDANDVELPTTIDALLGAEYRSLTVVEDPSLSSPGLAFLLATIDRYEEDWESWWERLVDNDVLVAPDWTTAWAEFSAGGHGGTRPVVVSYASSPPVDVLYADPPRETTRIGVVDDACFRQVEYAGVLRGTRVNDAAARVVQYMTEPTFQADLPLNMFVFPANESVPEPELFEKFALHPRAPIVMNADDVDLIRDDAIERWTDIVLS